MRVLEASTDETLCISPALNYASLPESERDDSPPRVYAINPSPDEVGAQGGCFVQPAPSVSFEETSAFIGIVASFAIILLLVLLLVLARRRKDEKDSDAEPKLGTFRRTIGADTLDEESNDAYLQIGDELEPDYVVQINEPLIALGNGLYAALRDVLRRETRGYFTLDDDLRDKFNLDGIYADSKIIMPDGTYAAVHDWFHRNDNGLTPKSRGHIYEGEFGRHLHAQCLVLSSRNIMCRNHGSSRSRERLRPCN